MKDLSVIITAGGIGKRMGGNFPKQFRLLAQRPVLMHTIQVFHDFAPQAQLILTLPAEWKEMWAELCLEHHFALPHEMVDGGKERFHSVKNALQKCTAAKIMIHDGVRPLVSNQTLVNGYQALENHAGAIPTVELVDSLRWVGEGENKAVNRSDYKRIQTPQCFRKEQILTAYEVDFSENFTDDASVFEKAGFPLFLFPGNEENLKITTENDLLLTEFWWAQHKSNSQSSK
ncbi:MAG: 2-C-methyl-D-erythritol 4-phosphate cytidylyltransferase [Crocinitomicaceae bacterium]